MDTKAIVNPVAGSHSVTKDWENIRYKIAQAGLEFDFEFTQYPGHAVDIARQSIENGYRCLLAVGGDGTINEVANGILISDDPGNIVLGVVNAGTANDFEMSLGISDAKHNAGLQWKIHQQIIEKYSTSDRQASFVKGFLIAVLNERIVQILRVQLDAQHGYYVHQLSSS